MLRCKTDESNGDFKSQTKPVACLRGQAEVPGVTQDSGFEQFSSQVRKQSYFMESLLESVTYHRETERWRD